MNANLPDTLMFLCQSDGSIVTADKEAASLLSKGVEKPGHDLSDTAAETVTIARLASKAGCKELISIFESFVAGGQPSARLSVICGDSERALSLRWLNGFQLSPLIAVELEAMPAASSEQTMLIEVGRATSRLIHDFKNQMGGLKLYAAYLKKRFASNPDLSEGLEIAEKIAQSLNEMTENATLVTKLARPAEVKLSEVGLASLIEQALNLRQQQIAERGLRVESDPATLPPMQLDSQQMLAAIDTLLRRAIEASPEGGTLKLLLRKNGGGAQLSIIDSGAGLTEEQQQSFFDFLTNERLNRTSLNLALARRIIESHGGRVTVLAAKPEGTEIRIDLKIVTPGQ